MTLVRILPKWREWFQREPDIPKIASRDFHIAGKGVSVYNVPEDQIPFAVAAHTLTNPTSALEPKGVLKIDEGVLGSFEILHRRTEGDTGLQSVDALLHEDLIAEGDQFKRFAEEMLLRLRQGADIVRVLPGGQVLEFIPAFTADLTVYQPTPYALEACEEINRIASGSA